MFRSFSKSNRSFRRSFSRLMVVAALIVMSVVAVGGAQAQTASSQCAMFYTVQRGDTLYRISRNFNISMSNLQSWNSITNANRIYTGQQLCVGRQVIVDDQASGRTHIVQPGDTLAKIARRYGVSMSVLAQVNNIINPNRIYAGNVLVIPDVTIQANS